MESWELNHHAQRTMQREIAIHWTLLTSWGYGLYWEARERDVMGVG
jgi:hypothetical protein